MQRPIINSLHSFGHPKIIITISQPFSFKKIIFPTHVFLVKTNQPLPFLQFPCSQLGIKMKPRGLIPVPQTDPPLRWSFHHLETLYPCSFPHQNQQKESNNVGACDAASFLMLLCLCGGSISMYFLFINQPVSWFNCSCKKTSNWMVTRDC